MTKKAETCFSAFSFAQKEIRMDFFIPCGFLRGNLYLFFHGARSFFLVGERLHIESPYVSKTYE